MEKLGVVSRRKARPPRRVLFLKLLCLLAAGALAVLVGVSPVGQAFFRGELPAPKAPPALIDAPFIDQREKYPTGCESVTAVMALQYAGVDITVEEFIDGYLPRGEAPHVSASGAMVGDDPWRVFLGSPYEESGWGCYAPVIAGAAERVLAGRGVEGLAVEALENVSLKALCRRYVEKGVPVMVWATIDMETPTASTQFYVEDTGQLFTWIYPLHCLLLTGEDGENYYFNDPLSGKNTAYPKERVEAAYAGVGSQAVVLAPAP